MKKTFACAIRPNKAPSMRRGLSIISLEHSYGLYGSRIFDRTQLAPKCGPARGTLPLGMAWEGACGNTGIMTIYLQLKSHGLH